MSNLTYADDIVILDSSYRKIQDLFKTVDHYATAIGTCITTSETKVMSALIPGKQRQAALIDGEPLEGFSKLRCLNSMFNAKGERNQKQNLPGIFLILSPTILPSYRQ